jgi:hypothetical protein
MIIWINATVCGDMNHGEQKAIHDRLQRPGRRTQGGEERDSEQGKREFRVARGKWRFVAVLVAE